MIAKALQALSALLTRRIAFEVDLIPLEFRDLPLKKIVNWLLTEGSVYVKPARPWGRPTLLQVEPTSRCNLLCQVCPVRTGMDRARGDMDFGLFRRLIDELGDYLLLIMFWDWGEPFLHAQAYEMIHYARTHGIRVVASTNGHVFAAGDHARRVVESGLDVLVFSVDGITEESYQHYRSAGRLEQVVAGIRRVVEERRRLGSRTPLVNFRFIVMGHNEHELPQVPAFARALGVDALTLRKFHALPHFRWDPAAEHHHLLPSQAKYQLPIIRPQDYRPVRVRRNPCKNLWNCAAIHWDGTVCSCFMDFEERRPLGRLSERSFMEIWAGEAYRSVRRAFRKHWQQVPLCGECAFGFEGGDVGRAANAEAVFFPGREGP
jgi:MoaA/NifB/PqqE/SkfB family radical SAM enzyme